jgi:hypothetical protein
MKKKYRPQEDRLLKQLSQAERAYQRRLRTRIINENLLSIA